MDGALPSTSVRALEGKISPSQNKYNLLASLNNPEGLTTHMNHTSMHRIPSFKKRGCIKKRRGKSKIDSFKRQTISARGKKRVIVKNPPPIKTPQTSKQTKKGALLEYAVLERKPAVTPTSASTSPAARATCIRSCNGPASVHEDKHFLKPIVLQRQPCNHDHEHVADAKSQIRVLMPLKTRRAEWLVYVKSAVAQSPQVSVVSKFGKKIPVQLCPHQWNKAHKLGSSTSPIAHLF
ncbi:hypothetical protein TNCV_755141 [Trichonephila clavipes]|nr:hypothetical protein TNCV_755141 [Trichonephila clavipes]